MNIKKSIKKRLLQFFEIQERKQRNIAWEDDLRELLELFEDDYSKEQFEREMYYLQFQDSFGDKISPCPPQKWAKAILESQRHIESGIIEKLEVPHQLKWVDMYATTYILKQYEYSPHVQVEEGDIFLDAGGFVGDTAHWALSRGAKKVYSFEPDSVNRGLMEKNLRTCGIESDVVVVPCGLDKTQGEIHFQTVPGRASSRIIDAVNRQGDKNITTINTIDLNSWCEANNVHPTFIKMDIEGAELEALRGAVEVINKYKPKLAICLYHDPAHMEQIPKLIKSIDPEYRLWCKKSHPRCEFVLLAAIK